MTSLAIFQNQIATGRMQSLAARRAAARPIQDRRGPGLFAVSPIFLIGTGGSA